MVFFKTVVAMACMLCTPLAVAADSYQCVAEMATGFSFDVKSGKWAPAVFTSGDKYVIATGENSSSKYAVHTKPEGLHFAWCEEGFNAVGVLLCEGTFGPFRFNRKTGRYLYAKVVGYWNVPRGADRELESGLEPYMEIGRCTPSK